MSKLIAVGIEVDISNIIPFIKEHLPHVEFYNTNILYKKERLCQNR